MRILGPSRTMLIAWAVATSLGACTGVHSSNSPVPATAAADAPITGTNPARGGTLSGGYSGVIRLSKCSFPFSGGFDFSGTGTVSFLRSGTESGSLVQGFNDKLYCTRWLGAVILTSAEHSKDQLSIALRGDKWPSPCGHHLVYTVIGGSGKFHDATGSGTVALLCSHHAGSSAYSDRWSGTLNF